jgi:GT2 family glycosyltransferase
MKDSISFCIATAKNEKEYIKLLLHSLKNNTNINHHEILVFIDSDNQNTYEELVNIKQDISNLRIYRNTNNYPIGGQRNISLMFNAASNDIVCYLQSDMVVGKDFDKHILKNITSPNTVLTCSRIEPPLHPASPEKIIKDFGVTPEDFKYDDFLRFTTELQNQNKPNMEGHFAPFVVSKTTWFEKLGGFDTQFRCSREDSDMIIRMKLAGLDMVQTWDASVYHFTCVSSRGKDWFRPDKKAAQQNILQQYADNEELRRFIRKWGMFGHEAKPIYDIGIYLNIDQFVDFHLLEWLEIHCKTLHINNQDVHEELSRRIKFNAEYYSNLRWKYSTEHWSKVQHLFNPEAIENHIQFTPEFNNLHDVNVYVNYSELVDGFNQNRQQFIDNINQYIHNYPIGKKEVNPFVFDILKKQDLSSSYIKVKNTQLLLENNKFVFE